MWKPSPAKGGRGRLDGKCSRKGGEGESVREGERERGEGMRGRQVHAVTTSCSQLSAAHGRLHVSVTWPDTLQETLAAFT